MNYQAQDQRGLKTPQVLGGNTASREDERPVIEVMGITAGRLEDIERKVSRLTGYLFGCESGHCGIDGGVPEPNASVASLASVAFGSSVLIERQLDEIYYRLVGN